MKGSILKAAFIGGIILFVWYGISYMVIPWNNLYMKQFKNTEEVAKVIRENTDEEGVYTLCRKNHPDPNVPYVVAAVKPQGKNCCSPVLYVVSVITQIICATLVAWMVSKTKGLDYFNRVKFITIAGVFLGIASQVPNWNWAGFPIAGALIMLVSTIIGWFLAGLAMARVMSNK